MLSILIIVPLFAAAILGFWPGNLSAIAARRFTLAIATALLLWTFFLAARFDPSQTTLQFAELVPWIGAIGLNYKLGADGLSLPLLLLNSVLTLAAIFSSDKNLSRPRFYYSLLLVLYASVAGAFLAQDLLLFFIFYELELIPLYFLIAIWGAANRAYAAIKFLIYTAVSGIFILASFLGLVWFSGAESFAYEAFAGGNLEMGLQVALLGALLVGFAIKIPIFPFHTWLPDAHVEASTPVSVLLAGVLLKLGTYGLLRFGVGLYPDAWHALGPWLAGWASVSALYGALAAIAQWDMKKVVAYSSIAHMAFILLGASAATPLSLAGAVAQMLSHGLISALLFMLVGVVAKKTGTRDVRVLRGLLNPEKGLPIIGSLTITAAMASAGIPGMVGFIAEFITFRGSFPSFPWQTLLCMIGTGLTAVYFLLAINRAFFGRLTESFANLPAVAWGDRLPAIVLTLMVIAFGLQPNWIFRWSEAQTTALASPPLTVYLENVSFSDTFDRPSVQR